MKSNGLIKGLHKILSIWIQRHKDLNSTISKNFVDEFSKISTQLLPIQYSLGKLKENPLNLTSHYCQYSTDTTQITLLQDLIAIMDDDIRLRKKSQIENIYYTIDSNLLELKANSPKFKEVYNLNSD